MILKLSAQLFFSDDYDISQKESHPSLKLFFTKMFKILWFIFLFAKITFLYPPPSFWNIRICKYVHTSLNRFLGRSRYLRNLNTLQISNSILQNFYFMQIYHIFTFEGLKLPKTMFWTILRQIKIFIMILKLSAQLFFQMIMIQ